MRERNPRARSPRERGMVNSPNPRMKDDVDYFDDDFDDFEYSERKSMRERWDDIDWNLAPESADEESEVAINVFGYFFLGCGVLGVLGAMMGVGG